MTYEVRHTIDGLGGRLNGSMLVSETDDLLVATLEAELLTRQGRGGFVRRDADGAVLAPNGLWIDSRGEAVS